LEIIGTDQDTMEILVPKTSIYTVPLHSVSLYYFLYAEIK
jgi:hypothetical protein